MQRQPNCGVAAGLECDRQCATCSIKLLERVDRQLFCPRIKVGIHANIRSARAPPSRADIPVAVQIIPTALILVEVIATLISNDMQAIPLCELDVGLDVLTDIKTSAYARVPNISGSILELGCGLVQQAVDCLDGDIIEEHCARWQCAPEGNLICVGGVAGVKSLCPIPGESVLDAGKTERTLAYGDRLAIINGGTAVRGS